MALPPLITSAVPSILMRMPKARSAIYTCPMTSLVETCLLAFFLTLAVLAVVAAAGLAAGALAAGGGLWFMIRRIERIGR
jgi:hypothetical protein